MPHSSISRESWWREAIPEPGILSLAALGLIGLAATRRRKVGPRCFLRNP